jgi:hypothetical protein
MLSGGAKLRTLWFVSECAGDAKGEGGKSRIRASSDD